MSEHERDRAAPAELARVKNPPAVYAGVGCLTAVVGLVGGGMIGVLVSKIVGIATRCVPTAASGAPCSWDVYWTWGARIGVVLLPAVALWRMWRSDRAAARNSH